MSQQIQPQQVAHIAQLAFISITEQEQQQFAQAFSETLKTIAGLQSVDVAGVEPTHQVTGLENVLRQDVVRPETMLSQEQALANAHNTVAGYFVVPAVLQK